MSKLFYFGRCIPWMIIGQIRAFDKYKLQQAKATSAADQWKCTKYVLSCHFTVQLPQVRLLSTLPSDSFNLMARSGAHSHDYSALTCFLYGSDQQIWAFHPIAEYFGMATHTVPFPHWTTMVYQIAMFFVFEELRSPCLCLSDGRYSLQLILTCPLILWLTAVFITGHTELYTRVNSTRKFTSFIMNSRLLSVSLLNMLIRWRS